MAVQPTKQLEEIVQAAGGDKFILSPRKEGLTVVTKEIVPDDGGNLSLRMFLVYLLGKNRGKV